VFWHFVVLWSLKLSRDFRQFSHKQQKAKITSSIYLLDPIWCKNCLPLCLTAGADVYGSCRPLQIIPLIHMPIIMEQDDLPFLWKLHKIGVFWDETICAGNKHLNSLLTQIFGNSFKASWPIRTFKPCYFWKSWYTLKLPLKSTTDKCHKNTKDLEGIEYLLYTLVDKVLLLQANSECE
jgi:hypothetical protein